MENKTATSFVRLGKKNDEATTNRPLLVSFDNEKDVNEVMKNLNKLKMPNIKSKTSGLAQTGVSTNEKKSED